MSRIFADYVHKAQQILDDNRAGSSTKPSPTLYPHQWNWDCAYIAIGLLNSFKDSYGAITSFACVCPCNRRNDARLKGRICAMNHTPHDNINKLIKYNPQ